MHVRGNGEAARRANRAIDHARGHLRVSSFARRTAEKREAARSLLLTRSFITGWIAWRSRMEASKHIETEFIQAAGRSGGKWQ